MGAFLDTGNNRTNWRSAGLSLLDSQEVAAARERISHVGGAGGVVAVKQRELPSISVDLGSIPVRLERVPLANTHQSSAAQFGMDAVAQFGTFILDFEHMQIDGTLKTSAERKATRRPLLKQADIQLREPENAKAPK
jgi:hypothetical protein